MLHVAGDFFIPGQTLVFCRSSRYISAMDDQMLTGAEAIKAALKHISGKPGVYRMISAAGDILYIGKAKNLKNRVSSYAQNRHPSWRIMRMVEQVVKVEITEATSEAEALLLEASLIKKHKPRYNILLKDDKSFPFLYIDTTHDFPRIAKHRGSRKGKGHYFGPFASVDAVNETLAILQKAFLLRPCADTVFANRSRPCLQYQIKRCSAPCVDLISKEAYGAALEEAIQFLRGKSRDVQERFAQKMQQHSEAMEYEQAAAWRDRIAALTRIQQEQNLYAAGLDDADVLALHHSPGGSCVLAFFFRGGGHYGSHSWYPRHDEEQTPAEIMAAFIGQFYQRQTPPPEILVNVMPEDASVLTEALGLRAQGRVSLHQPQRGEKRNLMQQAEIRAEAALKRHLNSRMSEKKQMEALGKLFGMDEAPQRIEVYDNSHIMGTHALGAMIVATPEGFDKKSYRRFDMKDIAAEPGDDYAMMRETFRRRFSRLMREDPERKSGQWPDLVLIDGGAGQLSAVREVLEDAGISGLCYVAIAKGPDRNAGREQFFMPDKQPFTLPPGDAALHYLQRLRDEAHRFAIGSHRNKRSKALTHSALDDIPGIGAARKKALLHHFGSRKGVEDATLSDLKKVPGISQAIAEQIYGYFHSD
jgi:excinuclease ABC subunit C